MSLDFLALQCYDVDIMKNTIKIRGFVGPTIVDEVTRRLNLDERFRVHAGTEHIYGEFDGPDRPDPAGYGDRLFDAEVAAKAVLGFRVQFRAH